MSIPTYEQIMLPLLKVLSDRKIYTNKECIDLLAKKMKITESELKELLPSGKKFVFYDRVNWAKTYMKKAGLVNAPKRGTIQITDVGLELLKKNPSDLQSKDLLRYDSFVEFINDNKKVHDSNKSDDGILNEKTPLEEISNAYKNLNVSLADELLEKINSCSFEFFEKLVIELLIKMGYGGSREEAGRATKKTGDGGIDGIINEDRLGLDSIYIQAKRWKDTVVGRPEIQKFSGALDTPGANKGIFITTSTFSKEARDYVKSINTKNIVLIDGMQLSQYMIEFNVGVSTEIIYEVKKIDTDYFVED
ncbi:MAG: restriction endonuclease [Clostridiaceae bacterium]|nr:restriction endonuclease [Clostridiaceae bacterium]